VRLVLVLAGGAVFGFGLAWSTMTEPEVVLAFLRLEDLGLLLVMAAGIAVAGAAFVAGPRLRRRPPLGEAYEPAPARLDRRTALGAAVFGVGWGLSGMCPGAALASLGTGDWPILAGLAGILAGAWLQARFAPDRAGSAAPELE
jgi:uncharacterized membrane protein YedE/YeeE